MITAFKSLSVVLLLVCALFLALNSVSAAPSQKKESSHVVVVDQFTFAEPSPSLMPVEQCESKFTQSLHLQCGPAALKFISITTTTTNTTTNQTITSTGMVRVAFSVKWGHVYYKVTGVNGVTVKALTIDMTTSSDQARVALPVPSYSVSGRFPTPIEEFEVAGMRDNCCGRGAARALVYVSACTKNGACGNGNYRAIGLKFPCAPTCSIQSELVVGVPMSATRKCPGCARA